MSKCLKVVFSIFGSSSHRFRDIDIEIVTLINQAKVIEFGIRNGAIRRQISKSITTIDPILHVYTNSRRFRDINPW